jgi:hypothetical protein
VKVVDCAGDGLSRGRAHGEEARTLVRDALGRWGEQAVATSGMAVEAYAARFLEDTGLIAAGAAILPDLVQEMRGIAEGAGVDESAVLAYNLMDEQWWYDLGRSADGAERGCSVLGVRAGRSSEETLLAQNMDLPAWMDGSQLVLRLAPDDAPEALVLTSAGLIGLTGVNRAGVAICVNTLLMLEHVSGALPVAMAMRGALRCSTREDAVDFLRSVRHASGQHYAVASADGFVGVECCAAGTVTSCEAGESTLAHTNHPLAHDAVDRDALAQLQPGRVENSHRRLEVLRSTLPSVDGLPAARDLLADRTAPLCVTPVGVHRSLTFGSVAFELSDPPRAEFCGGLPGTAPWEPVGWREG